MALLPIPFTETPGSSTNPRPHFNPRSRAPDTHHHSSPEHHRSTQPDCLVSLMDIRAHSHVELLACIPVLCIQVCLLKFIHLPLSVCQPIK